MKQLITQRPEVVAACEAVLTELMDTAKLDQKKERLVAEQTRIAEHVEALMNRASREVVEDFTAAYGRLETEMNRVNEKLDAVEREKAERGYKERQCKLFLRRIQSIKPGEDGAGLVDSDLFLALVDRVVMGEQMRFILRDGTEWTV